MCIRDRNYSTYNVKMLLGVFKYCQNELYERHNSSMNLRQSNLVSRDRKYDVNQNAYTDGVSGVSVGVPGVWRPGDKLHGQTHAQHATGNPYTDKTICITRRYATHEIRCKMNDLQ